MESGSKKEEAPTSLVGAMEEAYDVASEVLPNEAEMFDTITEAAQRATDAINAMKAAIESLNGMSVGGAVISSAHADGTVGTAFAEGTGNHSGLPHDEKNALRSEYGQPELTVYPNGTTELTTSPVMSDLPKGTVIYNEEQTKKIMDNKVSAKGNAHADGTNDEGWFTTPDGMRLRPLQPGDEMYDMIQKFDTYMKSIDNNIEKLAPNTMYEQNRQMHDIVNQINNSNVVNNNQPAFTINGGINVTCPGVNSKEVMSQVSTALEKEFSGLALAAYQRANITR